MKIVVLPVRPAIFHYKVQLLALLALIIVTIAMLQINVLTAMAKRTLTEPPALITQSS